jgi:archaellum component FlaG (FlaF/FlaG flagellin family)
MDPLRIIRDPQQAMSNTTDAHKYFPLLKNNGEKILLVSTMEELLKKGYLNSETTQAAFIKMCFSRGLNDYLKEVAYEG